MRKRMSLSKHHDAGFSLLIAPRRGAQNRPSFPAEKWQGRFIAEKPLGAQVEMVREGKIIA
jgi:hypothetical protein